MMSNFFEDYMAAWATEDVDTVMAFFDDDIVYEDTTLAHVANGTKEMRRLVKASFTSLPNTHFDVVGHVSDGTSYAIEWILQPVNVRGISIGTLRNGKIVANRDYWNGNAFNIPGT
jgi:ketosteroid isomerase-like protein